MRTQSFCSRNWSHDLIAGALLEFSAQAMAGTLRMFSWSQRLEVAYLVLQNTNTLW